MIKISGIIILDGKYAPSYPSPDSRCTMSGLKIRQKIAMGIENDINEEQDLLTIFLNSSIFPLCIRELILGIITPVKAVYTDNNRMNSFVPVV